MSRILLAFFCAFFAMSAFAQVQQPLRLPVDQEPLVFLTAKGEKTSFALEVADTDEARMRGLMFRTDFPEDRAMIFVFGEPRHVMMWMQNTPLPLDMVFLDEKGTISSIHENAVPFSEEIISSGPPAAYVVELRAGTAKRLGLHVADKAQHRVICDACRD